jgi:hypothetical protein
MCSMTYSLQRYGVVLPDIPGYATSWKQMEAMTTQTHVPWDILLMAFSAVPLLQEATLA